MGYMKQLYTVAQEAAERAILQVLTVDDCDCMADIISLPVTHRSTKAHPVKSVEENLWSYFNKPERKARLIAAARPAIIKDLEEEGCHMTDEQADEYTEYIVCDRDAGINWEELAICYDLV